MTSLAPNKRAAIPTALAPAASAANPPAPAPAPGTSRVQLVDLLGSDPKRRLDVRIMLVLNISSVDFLQCMWHGAHNTVCATLPTSAHTSHTASLPLIASIFGCLQRFLGFFCAASPPLSLPPASSVSPSSSPNTHTHTRAHIHACTFGAQALCDAALDKKADACTKGRVAVLLAEPGMSCAVQGRHRTVLVRLMDDDTPDVRATALGSLTRLAQVEASDNGTVAGAVVAMATRRVAEDGSHLVRQQCLSSIATLVPPNVAGLEAASAAAAGGAGGGGVGDAGSGRPGFAAVGNSSGGGGGGAAGSKSSAATPTKTMLAATTDNTSPSKTKKPRRMSYIAAPKTDAELPERIIVR